MTNPAFVRRIATLESARAASHRPRRVERHIIREQTDAARQARIASIVDDCDSNVLHICRLIVSPADWQAA